MRFSSVFQCKMYFPYVAFYILLSLCFSASGSEFDYDGWLQLRLWHALNDDPIPIYEERGNVTISNVRTGVSSLGQIGLKQNQLESLQDLARTNSKYRLKVSAHGSSGGETTFLTSVPACHLLGTDLEDILTVWLDSAGDPVSVTQVSPGPCSLDRPSTSMWTTSVQIKSPDGGPTPDTASYIYKLEREKEARERGETQDNRSLLSKYWIYVVLGVIFILMTSAVNPEGGPSGGGGGGGGGNALQRQ